MTAARLLGYSSGHARSDQAAPLPAALNRPTRPAIRVNALTVAARQYEMDVERASELALHGMTIFEPARDLAKQFQELATDARQLRDKITFLWKHILP